MSDEELVAVDLNLTGPFTIDEVIEIEDLAGCPITDLEEGPRGRKLRAVAYVVGKRSNPSFTLAQAGEFMVSFGGD